MGNPAADTEKEECELLESLRRGRPAAGQDPVKRAQIIEGARRVFIDKGFEAASMNDITREAGVSKGTIYVYFANKEELFEALIEEAEGLLRRAAAMGIIGRYQLEAAVQSAHTARRRGGATDWTAIRQLYDALMAIAASPVVAINRAVAIAETEGAAEGLAALDEIGDDRRLAGYQPYWAARAELSARLGMATEATEAYDQAIGLERDPALRRFLLDKRARVARA